MKYEKKKTEMRMSTTNRLVEKIGRLSVQKTKHLHDLHWGKGALKHENKKNNIEMLWILDQATKRAVGSQNTT